MKNGFGLEGKTAIITGAAQRLGKEIAQNMSQEGVKVVIADIQVEKGEQATEQIKSRGGEAYFVETDICDEGSIERLIAKTIEKYNQLDILVNNAKGYSKYAMEDVTKENWDSNMNVILSGSFFTSRGAISRMKEMNGGSIINILSIAATTVCAESVSYHVAKAGLAQLTKYLAYYAGPMGIRVNGVSPGFVIKSEDIERYESDIAWKKRWEFCHPLGMAGYGDDVSNAIMFFASDLSKFITGQTMVVDGGLTLTDAGTMVNRFYESQMKKLER